MVEEKAAYEDAEIVQEPKTSEVPEEGPMPDPGTVIAPQALVPIDGVTFTSAGKRFVMRPTQDVTAYEAMMLSQMVFCFLLSSSTPWDVRNYIHLHKLERHFMVSM